MCRYCVSGRETLCETQTDSGYSVNGAWAEIPAGRVPARLVGEFW
ncbi:alcohol dehydrogenase catalytic domain-containing protein [Pseudonocardia sp. WMMC193]|nr:alcohol dehydrogenase catalytic domain-containing protein [Pseudonocardia sp. WMMC193]MCF7548624.1 alcohol dehydrogenase catalytic domain-containing protein [Pseudonocardia sp. WMMC193]